MQEEVADELNRTTRAIFDRRNFAETLMIYVICGAVLAYMFYKLEPYGWLVSVLIIVLFVLLTYKRLQPQPLSLGPHECPRCHRIIYSSLCPYCQSGKSERFADV